MEGSSDAEAAVVEATDQRKQTGRKRVRTRAEKDAHNARCMEYRKNRKTRFEELEKLKTEVVPKLQAENQMMKMEREELISKIERLENERGALKKQVANQEEMIGQIPTSWEFSGQKFSSLEHCQDWILSQNYEQQVCQGTDYSNITASPAGPFFAENPDLTTLLDALNNGLFFHDLAASNITGTLTNPGTGSAFGANHGLPVNHDNIGLFTQNPTAGTPSTSGAGSSFGANHDEPVFGADNTGLLTYDPANVNYHNGALLLKQ